MSGFCPLIFLLPSKSLKHFSGCLKTLQNLERERLAPKFFYQANKILHKIKYTSEPPALQVYIFRQPNKFCKDLSLKQSPPTKPTQKTKPHDAISCGFIYHANLIKDDIVATLHAAKAAIHNLYISVYLLSAQPHRHSPKSNPRAQVL